MSPACFTCSRTSGAVSLFTSTCCWDILRSLLPDENIERVCFPNPNLRLCTKCRKVLLSISEFRNAAINSVRTQLEQWQQDMDPLGITPCVKMETENVVNKQEVINEDPNCDRGSEQASLHEEVMLESPEVTTQIKIEPCTEDNQEELLVDSYLNDVSISEDEAGSDDFIDRKIKSDPDAETTDRVTTRTKRKCIKESEASTSTRKRIILPSARKSTEYYKAAVLNEIAHKRYYDTVVLNRKDLQEYRSQLRSSKRFKRARHKCMGCLVTFKSETRKIEHRYDYHSKNKCYIKCPVCRQTMRGLLLPKHLASHYELIVCAACGFRTDDTTSMEAHSCEATKLQMSRPIVTTVERSLRSRT